MWATWCVIIHALTKFNNKWSGKWRKHHLGVTYKNLASQGSTLVPLSQIGEKTHRAKKVVLSCGDKMIHNCKFKISLPTNEWLLINQQRLRRTPTGSASGACRSAVPSWTGAHRRGRRGPLLHQRRVGSGILWKRCRGWKMRESMIWEGLCRQCTTSDNCRLVPIYREYLGEINDSGYIYLPNCNRH